MSLSHGSVAGARHAGRGRLLGGMGAGAGTVTPAALSMVKLLVVSLIHLPLSYAAPIFSQGYSQDTRMEGKEPEGIPPGDPDLYVYLGVAIALVLLGGVFAGLTIALMGQDEIYLQVIATSGEGAEKKHAKKVLKLLKRGKHWVLVTLLLSNVITNETLPIVLDRSLGGGWPAVLSSTVLIVIFGEVAPQSVCVRYGLPIGAFMSPVVLILMWIMAPVAWPTAKLLDWLLGEDHGTTYKKAGLKTLVTLHKTLGTVPGERLNEDEVTIITAVLDLKDKPVGAIMTPMGDVFTMSADTVLDEKMMDTILSQGYSRIPIYVPENPRNFIGMLLVKILITYDPEDCLRVRDFALATLPETAPDTSCLDIVNFFQEGKSHMVLVSDFPGQDKGALGVVTLEDVIEELIGEEIIDESDVFVDVHKAIRRITPAPRTRYTKSNLVADTPNGEITDEDDHPEANEETGLLSSDKDSRRGSTNGTTVLMRRRSSTGSSAPLKPVPIRSNTADLRQHLKHLGPSNVASRPKATKYTSVKIKPGVGTIPEGGVPKPRSIADGGSQRASSPDGTHINNGTPAPEGGAGAGLLADAARDAKDGALLVSHGYGTMSSTPKPNKDESEEVVVAQGPSNSPPKDMTASEASAFADQHTSVPKEASGDNNSNGVKSSHDTKEESNDAERRDEPELPEKLIVGGDGTSRPISREDSASGSDTLGEMENQERRPRAKRTARSGSITENVVNVGGMKKMVLETTSSSDGEDGKKWSRNDGAEERAPESGNADGEGEGEGSKTAAKKKKNKKKKRAGKKFHNREKSGDSTPLLRSDD